MFAAVAPPLSPVLPPDGTIGCLCLLANIIKSLMSFSFSGKNIFGYGSEYGRRVLSFFKDEPIVGGFLNAFYLTLIGFWHLKSANLSNQIQL